MEKPGGWFAQAGFLSKDATPFLIFFSSGVFSHFYYSKSIT